jgi:hypothetical protein
VTTRTRLCLCATAVGLWVVMCLHPPTPDRSERIHQMWGPDEIWGPDQICGNGSDVEGPFLREHPGPWTVDTSDGVTYALQLRDDGTYTGTYTLSELRAGRSVGTILEGTWAYRLSRVVLAGSGGEAGPVVWLDRRNLLGWRRIERADLERMFEGSGRK